MRPGRSATGDLTGAGKMPVASLRIDDAHELVFPTPCFTKKLTKQDNHVQSVEQFLYTALQIRKCIYFGRGCAEGPDPD
ncbi:hypothetical protein AGROH133_13889 [Agrobacterium tumefaciens]|nr:hypothetical protein AGROH133_13889 [Agrobacterium tumefaciens]